MHLLAVHMKPNSSRFNAAPVRTASHLLSVQSFKHLSLVFGMHLFPTFLAEGDGIVHHPADQSHE